MTTNPTPTQTTEPCPQCDVLHERVAELEADLAYAEGQRDRFLAALQRALPGHYESVLWFHYTASRWSISDKFRAWAESPKNTVKPFDPLHWMMTFGVLEDDVKPAKDGNLTDEVQP